MILGQLVRTVWHQGALARAHALDHCQKLRRRIAFHIQFAALLLTHRLQRLHIPVTGMPLILTRMQRDPMRAQAQATHGECTNIREILPPRIAQQGNLVDVDRQLCQREVSCAGRISIARPFESAARTPIAERCTCCVWTNLNWNRYDATLIVHRHEDIQIKPPRKRQSERYGPAARAASWAALSECLHDDERSRSRRIDSSSDWSGDAAGTALGDGRSGRRFKRSSDRDSARAGDFTLTKLSVNINKIALLRNSRGQNFPDVCAFAVRCLSLGAHGITLHPRQDQRHARYRDVEALQAVCEEQGGELNVEGDPSPEFLAVVKRVRPSQCTLVPDRPDQLTSDHGWNLRKESERLRKVIGELKACGIRVSLFIDHDEPEIGIAREMGADR